MQGPDAGEAPLPSLSTWLGFLIIVYPPLPPKAFSSFVEEAPRHLRCAVNQLRR